MSELISGATFAEVSAEITRLLLSKIRYDASRDRRALERWRQAFATQLAECRACHGRQPPECPGCREGSVTATVYAAICEMLKQQALPFDARAVAAGEGTEP